MPSFRRPYSVSVSDEINQAEIRDLQIRCLVSLLKMVRGGAFLFGALASVPSGIFVRAFSAPPVLHASVPHRPPASLKRRPSAITSLAPTLPSSSTTALGLSPTSGLSLVGGIDTLVALAALSATAKLLSTLGLGALAAKSSKVPNLLDGEACSCLSRLIYNVFQPAFLFCSVATTIATGGDNGLPIRTLLLMPLAAAIQIVVGSAFSSVASGAAGLEGDERRDARICMTFQNSGPLPLIFADALFSGSPLLTEITACVSFYLLMWTPTYWSYGRNMLGTYKKSSGDAQESGGVVAELKRFFSPPVMGAALGLIAGSVPLFRNSFMGKNGLLVPLFGAIKTLGTAYLPAALLVLAGSLVGSKNKSKAAASGDDQEDGTRLKLRTILSILFARHILAPLGGMATIQLLGATGLLPAIGSRARSVVTFAIMIEACMPPAQNTVVMLTLDGLTERAGRMAKALTVLYSLAIVPVTVLLSFALHQSNIMALK